MEHDKKEMFSPENTERREFSKLEKIAIGTAVIAAATAIIYAGVRVYYYITKKIEERYKT